MNIKPLGDRVVIQKLEAETNYKKWNYFNRYSKRKNHKKAKVIASGSQEDL